jgi:hypothetical protein
MAIASPPRVGRVYWTAYTQLEGDSSPTDPLRFDMYAERLGNVLLPGITSRVERLRYLGMVCAGLWLTRPSGGVGGSRDTARLWRRAFLPFEAGWAFANLVSVNGEIKDVPPVVDRARLKGEFQGLRGANRVLAYYRRVGDQQRVKPHNYRLLKAQEAQGGLGAYLVALRRYGFVQHDRFDLTASGIDLARAFCGSSARHASKLLSDVAERRATLRRLGDELLLSRPSRAEATIVNNVLFEGDDTLATVFRQIPKALRSGGSTEKALTHLARTDGTPLERAAQYAVTFDPFRRASLSSFVELGHQLTGLGPSRLRDLDTTMLKQHLDDAASAAATLAALPSVEGLEPVTFLAHRIAGATSPEETIHALISFHRQEGRRWIDVDGGDRYLLGAHGAFDPPAERFHGYTLGSAMRVYRDVQEVLA